MVSIKKGTNCDSHVREIARIMAAYNKGLLHLTVLVSTSWSPQKGSRLFKFYSFIPHSWVPEIVCSTS